MFYHWGKSTNFIRLQLSKTRITVSTNHILERKWKSLGKFGWPVDALLWLLLPQAKLLQSCSTLCDLLDCSQPGSSVQGILQARTLEGLPCPAPGDLPDPGIEPVSLMSPALAGRFFTTSTTWEACWFNSTVSIVYCCDMPPH